MKPSPVITLKRSLVVFADSEVGFYCCNWLIENYKSDLLHIVTTGINDIYYLAERNGIKAHVYKDDDSYLRFCNEKGLNCILGLLLWWPKIVKPAIINTSRLGFINTHPSLLPFNRGKHYNFWAIVEECPFGVSLHMVEKGIDSGDIVAQSVIEYSWVDTGETLYRKALQATKNLFKETYPQLRTLNFPTIPQDLSKGSLHYSSELENASRLSLDHQITVRDILNLLRARTFEGRPACSFCDDGVEYEVTIQITEKK